MVTCANLQSEIPRERLQKFYKSGSFEVSTQKVPFNHGDNDSEKVESIPDGWIIDEQNNLGIAIEVKDKKNNIRLDQLKSHIKRIESYNHSYLLVFTPDICTPEKFITLDQFDYSGLEIIWKSWDQIYWWLKQLQTNSLNRKDIFFYYNQ